MKIRLVRGWWVGLFLGGSAVGWGAVQAADPALELFEQGHQASLRKDWNGAAQKYQEFIQKFGTHAKIQSARLGLGLALLHQQSADPSKIAPLLDLPADDPALGDRPTALYWCGVAYREWARRSGAAPEAGSRLDRAGARFGEAAGAYQAQSKDWADKGDNELPASLELMVRSRCDQGEAMLGAGHSKEAAALLSGLVKERWASRSQWRDTLWYLAGCSLYAAEDPVGAARALVHLAPFEQPQMGAHAHYLLGRIHHVAGEATEAAGHYDQVRQSFDRNIMAARKALQSNAEIVRDHPFERARFEAMVAGPPPEFVGLAVFYSGTLLFEQRKFPEATERLNMAVQLFPKSPQAEEARYLVGVCLEHQGKHAEAVAALQPLLGHPAFGARAHAWVGRALWRGADPGQAGPYKQAHEQAAEHFKQAAAKLAERPENFAEAAGLQLEQADALRRAGRAPEAVPIYSALRGGPRAEEAWVRLILCYQQQGKYHEAEGLLGPFAKDFPHSPFMTEALFSAAECSFAQAQSQKDPAQSRPFYEEAVRRYEHLIAKFPDLHEAGLCRFRMAMARHALGQYTEAAASLASIAEGDRGGVLSGTSYVLADALLRAGPVADEARDALTASQRLQQLELAIHALQLFIAAQPQSPEAPEAMIKLGFCHQQVAWLLADPQERVKAASQAREIYEALRAQFPNHPLRPLAEYERANSLALAGDVATALSKFPRFHADPFAKAPIAPIVLLREAQLLRSLGRFPEAVAVLVQCRAQHEEELRKDPERVSWIPLLRYHHALALKELKQPAEGAKIAESLAKEFPQSEWTKACRELFEGPKP